MRCENWWDFEMLILTEEVKPQKGKISKEEYQDLLQNASDRAKKFGRN